MATFTFELVSPERVLFSGAVDAVVLPASEGDMTVLAGHAPTMTALKTGFLVITDRPGNGRRILVRGGFADVNQTEMAYDATNDSAARHAAEAAVAQLREAKAALNF
jgi:F-type H+-transporting ATPase subunit epsilon